MLKLTLITGLCASAAFTQTTTAPKDLFFQKQIITIAGENPIGPIGITAAMAGSLSNVPGAPYWAQAVTQRVQNLADGNRITQTTTNSVARDSKGRVYHEESLPNFGNTGAEPPHLILIDDPVAGVHFTLDSNSKTAMKMPSTQTKKAAEAAALSGPQITGDKMLFNFSGPGPDIKIVTGNATKLTDETKAARTDLGTQTIEGVVAKGTRITRTIPSGEMGNDLPLVITTETWYSPDLKLLIMSKSSDPRMGETTYKLTNISRAEPDPALFQIPADYTVKEGANEVFVYKTADKQ